MKRLRTLIAQITLIALPGVWPGAALAAGVFDHPTTPARAQAIVRAAMPALEDTEVLRGQFTQRRHLIEIPRPLTSRGEFLLVRGQGVWWHALSPIDAAVVLTPAGVRRDTTAHAPDRPAAVQPGTALVAEIFFALFALDIDTLARSFELFATQAGAGWQLGLRPRDAALATWFRQASVRGTGQVQQVTLDEATGDRLEIDLSATPGSAASLTPAERAHFGP